MYPKPCPRCPGRLVVNRAYKMPLAVCRHCGYFEVATEIPYKPDRSHTANLIEGNGHA